MTLIRLYFHGFFFFCHVSEEKKWNKYFNLGLLFYLKINNGRTSYISIIYSNINIHFITIENVMELLGFFCNQSGCKWILNDYTAVKYT